MMVLGCNGTHRNERAQAEERKRRKERKKERERKERQKESNKGGVKLTKRRRERWLKHGDKGTAFSVASRERRV